MDEQSQSVRQRLIVVDLDGTLIKTDSLVESVISILKTNLFKIFPLLGKLLSGKLALKRYVFEHCDLKAIASSFPVNKPLLDLLRLEKEKGSRLMVVSASDERAVRIVIDALELADLFDEVCGSAEQNLKGQNKLAFIQEKVGSAADLDIIYCGDSDADLALWQSDIVSGAVITGRYAESLKSSMSRAGQAHKIETVFPFEKVVLKDWLKAMRVHQWAKNGLLFVPMLCSFTFFDVQRDLVTLLAFLAFSLGASATYILNDLWDLPSDRVHATKCRRPFASGKIDIYTGGGVTVILLVLSVLLAVTISFKFLVFLLFYLVLTTLYSVVFKRIVLVDIIVLAALYVTRIAAGNMVADIAISYWLFSFAFMVFLSLGTLKRFVEVQKKAMLHQTLVSQDDSDLVHQTITGRGYNSGDLEILMPLGVSTYIGAIVLFGLYITSSEMVKNYSTPELLWLVQMIFFYLIGDMWFVAKRGKMLDDPVLYFVKDKRCLMCLVMITITAVVAYFL